MIEPTNRCNIKCITCFSHQDGRSKRDIMFKEFKYFIDENLDLLGSISLYNYGEPLLNPDLWNMVKYAKYNGLKHIKIATNGLLLDNKQVLEALKSGLDYLSISLDGATEKTYKKFRIGGDFENVIFNIRNLVKKRNTFGSKLGVEVQFIIMRHNEHEMETMKSLCRKLGVDILRFKTLLIKKRRWAYLLPLNKAFNRYRIKQRAEITCLKPLKELVVNSDGTVIPCCYITEAAIRKMSLGDAFKRPLREIIASSKYINFAQRCLTDKTKIGCCKFCQEGNLPLTYKIVHLRS